jgi:dihydrofolate reductase
METFVFSKTLDLSSHSEVSVVTDRWTEQLSDLKARSKGPIYLCGGGLFASWLLERGLIDELVLKRAPYVYGGGVRLFGDRSISMSFARLATTPYDNGYLLERLALA